MEEAPYLPLIWCDFCDRPQRHMRSRSADVPERSFDRATSPSIERGKVISVEMWRCLECGNERVYGYGTRWA